MAYAQLSSYERGQIAILQKEGYSIRSIADSLNRSVSTISRELQRNRSTSLGYNPSIAHSYAEYRKKKANERYKISEGSQLELHIMRKLRLRWSPDAIRGDLENEKDFPQICNETIYRFIKERRPEFKQYLLLLSHGNYRKRSTKKSSSVQDCRRIDERPSFVEERKELGHWEGDTIVFQCRRNALATFVERASGYLLAEKMINCSSSEMVSVSSELFSIIPIEKRKTCTNDNGSEFSYHKIMEEELSMTMYFAYPYHSWERGTNENTNRLLRQFFPKGTDFSKIEHWEVAWAVNLINHRPRKRRGYRTPHQVFHEIKECCTSG